MKRRRAEVAESTEAAIPASTIGAEVLAFLAENGLEATPLNYELGYLNRFDPASSAARSVDAILIESGRITQPQVDRIMLAHALHRARQLQGQQAGDEQTEVRRQTLRLADLAAEATAATGRFGRDIGDSLSGLHDTGIRTVVSTMLEHTRRTEQQLLDASRQIDKLRHDVEAARSDALRDALTGLLNRRGAEAELETLRKNGGPVTIAICDIDHFKAINDRYGHPVGDRVLKAVAAELAQRGSPYIVARWGGEEFAFFMAGVEETKGRAVVDAARDAVSRKTFRLRETDEPLGAVTLSAGLAGCPDGDIDAAIKAADAALYEAKAQGRNRTVQR